MPEHASRDDFAAALFDQQSEEHRIADWGGDELFTRMPRPRRVDDAPAPRFRPSLMVLDQPEERRRTAPGAEWTGENDRRRAGAHAGRGRARARRAPRHRGRRRRRARASSSRALLPDATARAEPLHVGDGWDRSGERPTKVITGRPDDAPRPLPMTPAERRRAPRTPGRVRRPAPRADHGLGLRPRPAAHPHRDHDRRRRAALTPRGRPSARAAAAVATLACRRPARAIARANGAPEPLENAGPNDLSLPKVRPYSSPSSREAPMKTQMSRFHHPRRPQRARGLAPGPQGRAVLRGAAPELPRRPRRLARRAARLHALPRGAAPRQRSTRRRCERIALAVAEHYRSAARHRHPHAHGAPRRRRHRRGRPRPRLGLRRPRAGRAAALPARAARAARPRARCTSTRRPARRAGPTSSCSRRSRSSSIESMTAMVNVAGEIPVDGSAEDARVLKAA